MGKQFADFEPLLSTVEIFDGKLNQHEQRATKDDLRRAVGGFLREKAELEQFFNDAIKVGGALFMMGLHFKVVNTL